MRYIGDVHGKWRRYKSAIRDCAASIQVGDMGVGFRNIYGEVSANPPYDSMQRGTHRYLRGNHDNPAVCRRMKDWIPDGSWDDLHFFVGGGKSIDAARRTEGLDYWSDEELSQPELYGVLDDYMAVRRPIMVTHECPSDVAKAVFCHNDERRHNPSRTSQALQAMFESYQPELWLFGHWHHSLDVAIEGTRFVCLAELETLDL